MKLREFIELGQTIPERIKYALLKCWELANDKDYRDKNLYKTADEKYPEKYLDQILPFFDCEAMIAITEGDKNISGFVGFVLHDHGASYESMRDGQEVMVIEYPFDRYYTAKWNMDANHRISFPMYIKTNESKLNELRKELVISVPPDMQKLMAKYYDSIAELDYDEIGDERTFEAICRFFDCEGVIPYTTHYTGQSDLGEGLCTTDNPSLVPLGGSVNPFYMVQYPKFDVAYLAYMDDKTEKFVVLKDVAE